MKLAAPSHRKLEIFFREYFGDENLRLPEIQIYARRGAKFLTKILAIEGITLGRYIFIRPERISRSAVNNLCAPPSLIAHEMAHTLQYQREGIFRFFYNYLKSYLTNLQKKGKSDAQARLESYWEIPYEIEARRVAAEYIDWCECRKSV